MIARELRLLDSFPYQGVDYRVLALRAEGAMLVVEALDIFQESWTFRFRWDEELS